MSNRWAVRFPRSSMHAALSLRLRRNVESLVDGDDVWLKSEEIAEEIERVLRCIPDVVRYAVDANQTITRIGRRIPEGVLPHGPWSPLSSAVLFTPQAAAMPARWGATAPIRLGRTQQEESPAAVVISIDEWAQYAGGAPQVRLAPLRFAVSADARALIFGSPLPSVRGSYYSNHAGLLLPCGYAWEPSVEAEVVRRAMRLAANDLALFDIEGSYELIPAESMIAASRSAARRSLAAFVEPAGEP